MQAQPFLLFSIIFGLFFCSSCKLHNSCNENPNRKLFVFIGQKIDVKELQGVYFGFLPYAKFTSKYKILETVCGEYKSDTIEFIAYDHYGFPPFAKFTNVLLFLENTNDTFYHVSYQYFDVYRTKDNKWASPYNTLKYLQGNDTLLKPRLIHFKDEVFYDLRNKPKKEIKRLYPEPYYAITENWGKATAMWGNYVPELFEMAKSEVLKERGFFGNEDTAETFKVNDLVMEDIGPPEPPLKLPRKDSLKLIQSWKKFITAIRSNDSTYIKRNSLPKVYCSVCEEMYNYTFDNKVETIDSFITSSKNYLLAAPLWRDIEENKFEVYVRKSNLENLEGVKFTSNDQVNIYKIHFETKATIELSEISQSHSFEFLKIGNEFKFYGMKSH